MKEDRPQYYLLVEKPRHARRKTVLLGVLLTLAFILSVIVFWDSLTGYRF